MLNSRNEAESHAEKKRKEKRREENEVSVTKGHHISTPRLTIRNMEIGGWCALAAAEPCTTHSLTHSDAPTRVSPSF